MSSEHDHDSQRPLSGSTSASGSPSREADGGPDANKMPDMAPPFSAQGWGVKWQPVTAEPNGGSRVIVATLFGEVEVAYYDDGDFIIVDGELLGDDEIAFWTYFPEAPRTQSVVDGAQPCSLCGWKIFDNPDISCIHPDCPQAISAAKREERSGAENAALSGGDRERRSDTK